MKAADDQVTRRKGTKAIPLRKHSIARPPGGRGAGASRGAGRGAGRGRGSRARAGPQTAAGREAPRRRRGPAPGEAPRAQRARRRAAGVGGARAAPACCETREVTKRRPRGLGGARRPPRGRDVGAAGTRPGSFRFWFGLGRGRRRWGEVCPTGVCPRGCDDRSRPGPCATQEKPKAPWLGSSRASSPGALGFRPPAPGASLPRSPAARRGWRVWPPLGDIHGCRGADTGVG